MEISDKNIWDKQWLYKIRELDKSRFCGDINLNVALQKYNIISNDQVPSVDRGGKTRAEVHTGSESARVLVHSISTVNGNQAEKQLIKK